MGKRGSSAGRSIFFFGPQKKQKSEIQDAYQNCTHESSWDPASSHSGWDAPRWFRATCCSCQQCRRARYDNSSYTGNKYTLVVDEEFKFYFLLLLYASCTHPPRDWSRTLTCTFLTIRHTLMTSFIATVYNNTIIPIYFSIVPFTLHSQAR